jgi:hypothetical protein
MKNNSMKKEVEFDYAEARILSKVISTKKSSKSHDSKPNSSDVKTGHGTPVTGGFAVQLNGFSVQWTIEQCVVRLVVSLVVFGSGF